ncbi:MAG: hypothetical protein ACXABY_31835 [Candidatus Thorarchaeota archaeon]|jgi:hypothetical protein
MPSLTIGFELTDPLQTKTIAGEEENVFDITASGAATIALSLTPTEFRWKRQQLSDERDELKAEIRKLSSPLNPQDTTALRAQLVIVQKNLLLASVVGHLAPGGLLA